MPYSSQGSVLLELAVVVDEVPAVATTAKSLGTHTPSMERLADVLMVGSLAGYFLAVLGLAVVLFVVL